MELRSTLTEEIARRLRGVSEEAALPFAYGVGVRQRKGSLKERLITLAASWGCFTHQFPVRIARSIALKQSTDADQPAMLTIVFGIGFVLLTYAIYLAIVGILVHSFWIGFLYLAGLLGGVYWAAFEQHPRRY